MELIDEVINNFAWKLEGNNYISKMIQGYKGRNPCFIKKLSAKNQ